MTAARLASYLRVAGLATLSLGMGLHLTVADDCGVLRAVFYALPWPVMALGWLATAYLWRSRRAMGLVSLMLALGCAGWWIKVSWRHSDSGPGGAPVLKVLSWNMAHEKLPSVDLEMLLDTFRPDVAGLVEVGERHSAPGALTVSLPPGYAARKLDYGMAIVVRGSIRVVRQSEVGHTSKFAALEAVVDGVTWRIFIVDGASRPITSREDVLARVLSEARAMPRTVVMGDFNTPLESVWFEPWRKDMRHAFDTAGSGFRETWPRWVPVLTIDHVWSSPDTPPLHAAKRWLPSSDHAALLVELAR